MNIKVLMFGWEFPPHITGGLGTACLGMTRGLSKQNVDVLFVMPSASGDEDTQSVKIINASDIVSDIELTDMEEYYEHIHFLEIGSNLLPYMDADTFEKEVHQSIRKENEGKKKIKFNSKYKFSGKYGTNLMEEVARYAVVAATIAKENTFDVIHAHDWLTYAAGVAAKKVSGKPLVIHVHATEFDRSGENVNSLVYDIERNGMLEADKIITVSDLTRNIVIEKYGINPEKVVTVHNAVDFSTTKKMSVDRGIKDKIVTFLGRVTYQKGPEYFIEAAHKVIERYPNVRFVMAGSGDMLNKSISRVAELGMGTKFSFTGFLRGEDVKKMFSYSDVYVMPSVSEPFGISPLEAMREGVPTIISKQSGVSEVLKHVLKVDFWNINSIADSIYGLLAYPILAKVVGEKGYDEVITLKWEDAAKKIKNVYLNVIK